METTAEITHARLKELFPNPYQPQSRLEVKEEIAREFGQSILEKGLLQVPVVRAVDKGSGIIQLQMVDGWLRRSGYAWLVAHGHPEYEKMPVILRAFTDQQMADIVYESNKMRKDLTPIDLAWYYKKILAEFKILTQTELAKKLKISQGEIANTMRLLELPERVQQMIISHDISESHGRALLQLKESDLMIRYAEDAVLHDWPVATLDAVLKTYLNNQKPKLVETPPPETKSETITKEESEEGTEPTETLAREEEKEEKADEKSPAAKKSSTSTLPQPRKKVDEKPPEISKLSTAVPATPPTPPADIKPIWSRKLVIEEKKGFCLASCSKAGGMPEYKKIEGGFLHAAVMVNEWLTELEEKWSNSLNSQTTGEGK